MKIHRSVIPKGKTRKYLIDGGFHIGEYTKRFLRRNRRNGPGGRFRVYAFEPERFLPIADMRRVTLIHKALWKRDEKKDFYIGSRIDAGSLIRQSACVTDKNHKVECIDFSKWLLENFTRTDFIHLKLDIEGAEYEVLDKMIADGSISLISELVCEWHGRMMRGKHRRWRHQQKKDKLVARLKTLENITWLQEWR